MLAALLATHVPTEEPPVPPTAIDAQAEAYSNALYARMSKSDSPRERALVARVLVLQDKPRGTRLLLEAAQAAPADGLVQMLWTAIGPEWSGCPERTPCPEQPLAWARAEPDNGLALASAFESNEGKSGDDKLIDVAISRIAKSKYYDDHTIDAWNVFRAAYAAQPMPPVLVERMNAVPSSANLDSGAARRAAEGVGAMAHAAALSFPIQGLSRACNRANHPGVDAARFEDCARIGRGMLASDSAMMVKSIGASLLRHSGQASSADLEAGRAYAWLRDASTRLMAPREYAPYFEDLASTGSETRAQELLLARHGESLVPPADWKARE